MHCPKCGFEIESDEVNFCSRCGLTLTNVRAAMEAETALMPSTGRGPGINIGVVLMFIGTLPALAAVLTSPIALPAAFLMLLIAFVAVLFGSGPLLRAFRTDEALITESAARGFRKEIAFGATMMFFGVLVASFFIAVVPDWYAKPAIIAFPILVFAFLLLSSRRIFDSIQEITGGERLPKAVRSRRADETGAEPIQAETAKLLTVPARLDTADLSPPPSVTENTTRHLAKGAASGDLA